MTQQRSDDEIRRDLALTVDHHGDLDEDFAGDRLIADVAPLLARVERAEAQIRAVEELQGPLNQLQMTWWSDYPGAEHEKEAARRTLVHQLVKGLSAALAAGLSLQEEQE